MDHVILLHGLGRTPAIMDKMADDLTKRGYGVHNIGYASTARSIDMLTQDVFTEISARIADTTYTRLHFVGHSLGGILIRRLLQQHVFKSIGRVVLLAPPNRGSEVAHFLSHSFLFKKRYRKICGPAGVALGSVPIPLVAPDYECGIIAGSKTAWSDLFFSWFILPSPNDGKVTVASTYLSGMKTHTVLPVAHSDLPQDPRVIAQTALFLAHGFFDYIYFTRPGKFHS